MVEKILLAFITKAKERNAFLCVMVFSLLLGVLPVCSADLSVGNDIRQPFGKGILTVKRVAHNAFRIRYTEGDEHDPLPDWTYVTAVDTTSSVASPVMVQIDSRRKRLTLVGANGETLFCATSHQLHNLFLQY